MKTRWRSCCCSTVISCSYICTKFSGALLGTKWGDTIPARLVLSKQNWRIRGVCCGTRDTNSCKKAWHYGKQVYIYTLKHLNGQRMDFRPLTSLIKVNILDTVWWRKKLFTNLFIHSLSFFLKTPCILNKKYNCWNSEVTQVLKLFSWPVDHENQSEFNLVSPVFTWPKISTQEQKNCLVGK